MDDSEGAHFLKCADAFARDGKVSLAVHEYLRYCEHVERFAMPELPDARRWDIRLIAVRKQVLAMQSGRRDVRRKLAENYARVGLMDDAREQLRQLAAEWQAVGDGATLQEVLNRLRELE